MEDESRDHEDYTQHVRRDEYTNRWINRCNHCQYEYEEMFYEACPECFSYCQDCGAIEDREVKDWHICPAWDTYE